MTQPTPPTAAALAVADGPQTAESELSRGEWLSPVELREQSQPQVQSVSQTPRCRASDKGFLPLNLQEYPSLLDWTGRQTRTDKRGQIPAELSPILERLQLSSHPNQRNRVAQRSMLR